MKVSDEIIEYICTTRKTETKLFSNVLVEAVFDSKTNQYSVWINDKTSRLLLETNSFGELKIKTEINVFDSIILLDIYYEFWYLDNS